MEARYNYRLRVNEVQARSLQQVFDACRFVWNTALGRWSDLWRHEQIRLGFADMGRELTDWRGRFDWLAAVPVTPQQQVLRDLDRSIRAFYDKKNPAGRPRFKRKKSHATASWNLNGFALDAGRLSVAVAGGRARLRVVWSRPLPSAPKSVTVYRDAAGRWWASFVVRVEPDPVGVTGQDTGVDVGLTTFATTEYADADVPNPRFARAAAKALARSQRNLARKQKGSRNRTKAKTVVAKVHARVANQRRDWHHKQARTLARRFDRIGVEDLRITNMVRNRHLARAIHDAGWGGFLAVLDWQARKAGHEVVRLDPRNTTQTCSGCGAKAKHRLGLADRIFACSECGLVEDRDRNAARNLNPNRRDKPGAGVDGHKTTVPAGTEAA
jgi:putative transposase